MSQLRSSPVSRGSNPKKKCPKMTFWIQVGLSGRIKRTTLNNILVPVTQKYFESESKKLCVVNNSSSMACNVLYKKVSYDFFFHLPFAFKALYKNKQSI